MIKKVFEVSRITVIDSIIVNYEEHNHALIYNVIVKF